MSARVAVWLAWSLCLMSMALAAASLILALVNGRTLGEISLALGGPSIASLAIIAVSFSVVGALIASRRPGNPIGWVRGLVSFGKLLGLRAGTVERREFKARVCEVSGHRQPHDAQPHEANPLRHLHLPPSTFPDEIMVYESGTSVIGARYETLHPT